MREQNSVYYMTDREYRAYKRQLRRQRELRRRMLMIVMTVCFISIGVFSYNSFAASANTGEEEISFKYYTNVTVAYGETLWDIVDDYIDYEQYADKEVYIAEVRSINHLDSEGNIKAGQNLVLPYYSNEFVK